MTADVVRLPCHGLGIRTYQDRDVAYVIRPDTDSPGPHAYAPRMLTPVDDTTRNIYCERVSRAVAARLAAEDAIEPDHDWLPACAAAERPQP